MEDQYHYITSFNTQLSPEEEKKFQSWVAQESEKAGYDKSMDLENYDLRGAWKEIQQGDMAEDDRGHLGDKYKKPNHPTFSDQSIYHNTKDPKTGRKYQGGSWSKENEMDVYTPSKHVMDMQGRDNLLDYFRQVETDKETQQPYAVLRFPNK